MVNPKVKAAFERMYSGNTFYCAYDLSEYDNDVKTVGERKLELFRTDTNALIRSQVLDSGTYKMGIPVRSGPFPNDTYLDELGIRAVLSNDGEVVSEDIITFVSTLVGLTLINPVSVEKTTDGFTISDTSILDPEDYDRFAIALRRNTSNAQLNKLEYVKELEGIEVEFPYFNEMLLVGEILYFNKSNHQVYTGSNAAFVNQEPLLRPLYSPGGTYVGTPNFDPLGNEDAEPNLDYLTNQSGGDSQVGITGGIGLRPHSMIWNKLGAEFSETEEGYPIPVTPGEERVTRCRFHLGGSKVFKNEDSTTTLQVGTIRCDVGEIPEVGQIVEVVGHFKGVIREVYHGQMSHRLEV